MINMEYEQDPKERHVSYKRMVDPTKEYCCGCHKLKPPVFTMKPTLGDDKDAAAPFWEKVRDDLTGCIQKEGDVSCEVSVATTLVQNISLADSEDAQYQAEMQHLSRQFNVNCEILHSVGQPPVFSELVRKTDVCLNKAMTVNPRALRRKMKNATKPVLANIFMPKITRQQERTIRRKLHITELRRTTKIQVRQKRGRNGTVLVE